jgi:hypothetical protein
VQIAQLKSGLANITVLPQQETARVQVLRNPLQLRLLLLDRLSPPKLNPGSTQTVIFSRKLQRLERHVGLLPTKPALTWPISPNGTLSLDQMERIATRRYGHSIITACVSRQQRQMLLPQRQKRLRLPPVLQNLPRRRLVLLPIARNGWRPKMVTPAGPSLTRMASMQTYFTHSIQHSVKVVQTVGHKSGQRTFTVFQLEGPIFVR